MADTPLWNTLLGWNTPHPPFGRVPGRKNGVERGSPLSDRARTAPAGEPDRLRHRVSMTALLGLALTGAVTSSSAGAAGTATPYHVIERPAGPELRLSTALARAVKRHFAGYYLPTAADEDPQLRVLCREQHPGLAVTYAAHGDFNGDGRPDAALRLKKHGTRAAGLLVAFHATRGAAFRPELVDRWASFFPNFCIARARPGRIQYLRYRGGGILQKPGLLTLRHDGIELNLPDGASRTYFWDGRRYRHVQTAD